MLKTNSQTLRPKSLLAVVPLVCGVLFLAACGGGGGGSASPTPTVTGLSAAPATGPGDTDLLFPMAAGSNWTYDTQQTQTGVIGVFGLANVAVSGTGAVSNVMATKFTLTSNIAKFTTRHQFYTSTAGGITFYGNDDPTDPMTNQLTPAAVLLFPVSIGAVSSVSATGIAAGRSAAGDTITANLTQQTSVAGIESVTVGAGVFPRSVKVVTTTSGTLLNAATGQSTALNATDTSWYAPGAGLVQELSTADAFAAKFSQSWSARGYTVNGVQHGLAAPTLIASGISPLGGQSQSASSGSNALVLSSIANRPTGYLIGNGGTVVSSIGLAGSVPPLLAFDGTNYVCVSYGQNPADNSNYDLSIQRISPAGTVLDASPGLFISSFANIQAATPLAVGGGHGQTLLVFTKFEPQTNTMQQHLFGMFIDSNGNPSSAYGFQIQATSTPLAASIAFDGANYLLVWQAASSQQNAHAIYATRVSPSGVALDPAPVLLSNGASGTTPPAVAFDGTNYLVVWGDTAGVTQGLTGGDFGILGRRISPAGALLDGPPMAGAIQVSSASPRNRQYPVLAFNGIEYIVAWLDYGSSTDAAAGVRGARVTPAAILSSGTGYEIQFSDRATSASGGLNAISGSAPQFTWVGLATGFSLTGLVVHPF